MRSLNPSSSKSSLPNPPLRGPHPSSINTPCAGGGGGGGDETGSGMTSCAFVHLILKDSVDMRESVLLILSTTTPAT